MAMSNKEAAIRTIEQLPDDASWDDVILSLTQERDSGVGNGTTRVTAPSGGLGEVTPDEPETPVEYHLERRGWATVLVPNRPAPPLPVTFVQDVIDEMRREREDRWPDAGARDST
jgi:hypothetical protein